MTLDINDILMHMRRSIPLLILTSLAMPLITSATTISLDPAKGNYGIGDTFVLTVRIRDQSECFNAAQIDLDYPMDTLKAVDFSRGDSIFSLWIDEPVLDNGAGKVLFAGGIPGGYCGRIKGDPAQSNVLGKVVFSVIAESSMPATVAVSPLSEIYLNDGLGTKEIPTISSAQFSLGASSTLPSNAWIREVQEDTIPPDPFTVQVQMQKGILGGKYFAVFSTVDKQSGLDHYDIFQKGGWSKIQSPYVLTNTSERNIQIRAVDKAGNERIGDYTPVELPPISATPSVTSNLLSLIVMLVIVVLLALLYLYIERRHESHASENT